MTGFTPFLDNFLTSSGIIQVYNLIVSDIIFLLIIALLFGLTIGLVWICQRLMRQ